MNEPKTPADTIITGSYEISLQLAQGRSIVMKGYVYADETNEALNARLDAAQDALDRQFVRTDVVVKEAQIDAVTAGMRQYREHVAALVEKKNAADQGGKKLSSQEKLQLDKLDSDLANFNAQIESLQAAVKKGRQRLNGALQA